MLLLIHLTFLYSGENLNSGSKLVLAAYGDPIRSLTKIIPDAIQQLNADAHLIMPGVIALNASKMNTGLLQSLLNGLGTELLEKLGVALGFTPSNVSYIVNKALSLIDKKVDLDTFIYEMKNMYK